jgi:hypothetical protein
VVYNYSTSVGLAIIILAATINVSQVRLVINQFLWLTFCEWLFHTKNCSLILLKWHLTCSLLQLYLNMLLLDHELPKRCLSLIFFDHDYLSFVLNLVWNFLQICKPRILFLSQECRNKNGRLSNSRFINY